MGIRYYRRANLGNGLGLNISKSGVAPSIRTDYGSVGTRGFSIRSGIPGLTFRNGFGKKGGSFLLILLLASGIFIVIFNVARFLIYSLSCLFKSIFKAEGIDYKNLVITLSIFLCLLIVIYYFVQVPLN
jgi:hypothetical protein